MEAEKQPTKHTIFPTTKTHLAPNVNSEEVERSCKTKTKMKTNHLGGGEEICVLFCLVSSKIPSIMT